MQPLSSTTTKSELIAQWCERLGDAFGRVPKDGLVNIWQERLATFDNSVLQMAFYHIEGHDERFPTVSRCIEACGVVSPGAREPFCPEAVDSKGVQCWIDTKTGEYLYRAQDCPEGREFIKTLAIVAGKVDL